LKQDFKVSCSNINIPCWNLGKGGIWWQIVVSCDPFTFGVLNLLQNHLLFLICVNGHVL
jgi:hypothetical protein